MEVLAAPQDKEEGLLQGLLEEGEAAASSSK